MADIDATTYKLETPLSENDSNYEMFEYLLCWYGRNGEFLVYMFTDLEAVNAYSTSVLSKSNADKMQNIIANENRGRIVTAEDISLNDLEVLSSIFVAKKIIRLFKDGTFERIGLSENNTLSYRLTNGRYNMPIQIMEYEKALPQ